ncbi:multicopper oxidase domain-containing protein [Pseudonocardia acidicola]|uniref:multicopper oxidase domain-containing protein n=1 Tax=Pseudonocardia acidicola TaxID=2724939 RepID=UPI001B7D0EFB
MSAARLSRRDMVKFSALGAAAVALPLGRVVNAKAVSRLPASRLPKPYTLPFVVPPVLAPVGATDRGEPIYEIRERLATAEILPGFQTPVFGYNGMTPGPTIKAQRGQPIVVRMINELPATHPQWGYTPWTSCHLHGSASKPQYDGYASDITQPGEVKEYHYPNIQDARTLWYHDHGVHHTAENAYMGLAAQYHLTDGVEAGLPIPKGAYDVPLILADKMFGVDGSFMYDDAGHSGLWGDVILVNGRPWPSMTVAKRKYRFRVLNASLSRGFRLQLGNGAPMTVIATDGGLMPAPQQTTQLRIGMAERYEVVIDFAAYKKGDKVELRNLGVPNSVDYDNTGKVMQFEVTDDPFDPAGNEVPAALNPNMDVMGLLPAQAKTTTKIEVIRKNGFWTVNGQTWDDVIKSEYKKVVANPKYDEIQIWEIKNSSGGWFHPVHIHLVDFQILDRNGKPPFAFEKGPKDVAYVGENEVVRAIMKFTNQTGRYMIHCHNLPHEDHDMMVQFRVGDDTADNDPIESDRPRKA